MATSSLLGRRIFLTAAQRSTYRFNQQAFQSTALRAASSSSSAAASTTAFQSHSNHHSSASSSRFALLSATAALALAAANNDKSSSKCCGIAGVVGAKGDARDYLIEGLTILKNRGYDSAGIATMDDVKSELVVSIDLEQPHATQIYAHIIHSHSLLSSSLYTHR